MPGFPSLFARAKRAASFAILVVLLACRLCSSVHAVPIKLGIIGDSLSDEHFESSYSTAGTYSQNWVQQLVQYNSVDVGPTAQQASQPGNTWGEPRRTGYAYNYARYADSTSTLLSDNQHTGLAGQIGPQNIGYAVMAIGANNFLPNVPQSVSVTTNAYNNIYNGSWTATQINNYVNQSVAEATTALDALLATGVNVVMANFADYSVTPYTLSKGYANPSQRQLVTNVIDGLNLQLQTLAQNRQIVLADLNGFAKGIFGTNASPNSTLTIGGVSINLTSASSIDTGSNPTGAFIYDGIHPNTTLHGMLANMFMAGLNTGYNANLSLYSESNILAHKGLAYGGSDTLGELGQYNNFVHSFVPEPSSFVLTAIAALGVVAVGYRKTRRQPDTRFPEAPLMRHLCPGHVPSGAAASARADTEELNVLGHQNRVVRGFRVVYQLSLAWILPALLISNVPSIRAQGVPALSSRPGAPYTIFLDFDGASYSGSWLGAGNPGVTPAYNINGYSNVQEIWSRVSEKLAPFNLNVTTIDPRNGDQSQYDVMPQFMRTVVGGNGSWAGNVGGISALGTMAGGQPANSGYHTNWVFPGKLFSSKNIAEAIVHEDGHALGLAHQSLYDAPIFGGTATWSLNQEYDPGDTGLAPVMGNSYYAERGVFRVGTKYSGTQVPGRITQPPPLQNDLQVIAANPGLGGFINDGIGHTFNSATPIPLNSGGAGINSSQARGVIVPSSNSNPQPGPGNYLLDFWSFSTTGGLTTIKANAGRSTLVPGIADPGATLNAALEVYNGAGAFLTSLATDSLSETASLNLPAGTYVAKIGSSPRSASPFLGGYFDVGSYFLTGTVPTGVTLLAGQLAGTVNGGSSLLGGVDFSFGDASVVDEGVFSAGYYTDASLLPAPTLPSDVFSPQWWDVEFTGSFTGVAQLTFAYDPLGLSVDESLLHIFHWSGATWDPLSVIARDLSAHTITIEANSFSPFALGLVPEPSTFVLAGIGCMAMFACRRRFCFERLKARKRSSSPKPVRPAIASRTSLTR